MKAEILKLISDEERKIREFDRTLENVNSLSDERFNCIMSLKGASEGFVEKLKSIII